MEDCESDSDDSVTEVVIKEEIMSSVSDSDSESEDEEMMSSPEGDEKDEEAQASNSRDTKTEAPITEIQKTSFVCTFCSIEYSEQAELESHLSSSHKPPNPYTCAFCTMACANSITLSLHTKMAHKSRLRTISQPLENPMIKCEVCGNMFSSSKDLLSHQHKQHNKCIVCLEFFPTSTILRTHIRKEHYTGEPKPREKMPKACPHCKKMFNDSFNLKLHIRKHTGEKPFTCNVCDKKLSNPSNFKRHVESHTNGERPYQCEICNKSFRQADKLRYHEKLHFGARAWVCETCGKGFVDASTLRKHNKIHTRITFFCNECPREFLTVEKLEIHQAKKHSRNSDTEEKVSKSGKKRFECFCCGKRFRRARNLKVHEKTHEDDDQDQTHECDYCGETFNSLRSMKQHEKIHTFAEYTCDHCGESYTLENSLKQHLKRKHPELKEGFKEFAGRSAVGHVKAKTEPGNFLCVECDKSYAHERSLKKHIKKVHGEKRDYGDETLSMKQHETIHTFDEYTCDHCGESYTLENSLKQHLKTKHPEWEEEFKEFTGSSVVGNVKTEPGNFLCVECGKSYAHECSLKKHMKKEHAEKRDNEDETL